MHYFKGKLQYVLRLILINIVLALHTTGFPVYMDLSHSNIRVNCESIAFHNK